MEIKEVVAPSEAIIEDNVVEKVQEMKQAEEESEKNEE